MAVEFVLVRLYDRQPLQSYRAVCLAYLEVSELREHLATAVEFASKWLCARVGVHVLAHVAALRKRLAAQITMERLFASVTALVGLRDD